MSINSSVSSISTSSSLSNTSSSSKTTSSSDNSFKDEMAKVDQPKETKSTSEKKNEDVKVDSKEQTKDEKLTSTEKSSSKEKVSTNSLNQDNNNENALLNGNISINGSIQNLSEANNLLSNDILQMINNTTAVNSKNWSFGFESSSKQNNLSMNESDAQFFLNLTQTNDVSMNNVVAQAQNLLNSGVDSAEVRQNFQVSQTLLNALSEARQNNQPLRIDFDQNISVILRVGKDGSIAANFIPGDKVVEQYLKSNIESLKNIFEENDLPYTELSYSNSSKRENERRRNKQQGEQ